MKNTVPKLICINDLSGYGRCSLTTAISILSVLGVQPCPVPTAILSKHTAFSTFYFKDLTECMESYLNDWSGIEFDGIYSGFLGSLDQIHIVENYMKYTKNDKIIIVDPVMGDNGEIYSTYDSEMCQGMKHLISFADVITPNVTEACFLTDTPYTGNDISICSAEKMIEKLLLLGAKSIVITGIRENDEILNCSYEGEYHIDRFKNFQKPFSGTGDIFASIVSGLILKGKTLQYASRVAGNFVHEIIFKTIENGFDISEGIAFEPYLKGLAEIN